MIRVIDASVAIKWFVPEPLHDAACALLSEPGERIAPDWLLIEAANVLWKQERRGFVAREQAENILALLPDLVETVPAAGYVRRALAIASRLGHSVYDCLYLAIAEQTGGILVTTDVRLAELAGQHGFKARAL